MSARDFLDSIEPHFTKGGRLEKYFGLYEMVDTFIYTPAEVTRGATHVRDGNDLKRTMTFVVVATFFCVLMAMYNTGYQANVAMEAMGLDKINNWRSLPMAIFGYSPANPFSCMVHGALYFFPIYLTTIAIGGVWEVLFATVRKHEVN
ncbi:MAG: RnfABCDGE type electron transport complex subunit D, partial [Methylobacter sp.]